MPAKLKDVVKFLNKELRIRSIKDESRNGLQVMASNKVHKIDLATDACLDVFEKAKKLNCNLVIMHHGLLWKGKRDTAGLIKNKVRFLERNHISLYAVHLPLDKSKKYGHNTYLFRLLDAEPEEIFGGGGYLGHLNTPKKICGIAKELEKKLNTKCIVWKFGKDKIRRLAIVSGAGSSDVLEAIKKKADLLVTGEAFSWAYHNAKEGKIDVILAGHYKTETSGVKALGKLLEERFDVRTAFIDVPTGL